ncbi:MAG TPA: NADH-quinone oxidoreductase subunit L [Gaiellaceae bacterium]|nr:NADH-quinone oxidoreductase subunit L [Gaiellaceae bacterium]
MIAGAWLCLWAPLAGTVLILLGGTRMPRKVAAWVATTSVFVAFAGALWSFFALHANADHHSHYSALWTWLAAGKFTVPFEIVVDPLSTFMMLIVSGVGGLIVLYSIGYMDGDDEERRYFAYIAFFVFSMLLLVEGGNMLLLLVGWGLVGLSSYLLIGFWHERPSAVAAAKKAFIMNAFGDATFALALFVLIAHSNSLEFATSFATASHLSQSTVDLVALGLLGGAAAKSAQVPLHTWLPDAMEGPTPVSALIHAATMVTAGVYLIARTHPIFEDAPTIALVAAGLGAITLLMAGMIALVQTDIKRVIAYSTMSQIGYMFMAAGVGAFSNGMFHLMTHAFFKALLFMAAGLVIHAVADEQDIRKLRGVGALMPFTKWAFLIGAAALVGIPAFSGFFSKDPILAADLHDHWYGVVFWACGLVGTFLTGLYTFRLYFIVFPGEPSPFVREHYHSHHGREGSWTMLVPVGVLTVLAAVAGWIQFQPFWEPITHWLSPVIPTEPAAEATNWDDAITSVIAPILGIAGIVVAWLIYGARQRLAVPRIAWLQRLLEHKFYFDEAYDLVFYKPAVATATLWRRDFEEPVVLTTGSDLGEGTLELGNATRRMQNGLLRTYVFFLGAGMAVLAVVFLAVR